MDTYVPAGRGTAGPTLGPRERWLFAIILLGIAVWGFTGSWEYPSVERTAPVEIVVPSAPTEIPQETGPSELAQTGAALFEENGCYACHSVQGETKIGPHLNGIFGTSVALDDGGTVTVDEAYIIESILVPEARIVAGFEEAAMPSYDGLVTDQDAAALVEYIKSLR